MTYLYSALTGGFYLPDSNNPSIPNDVVEITDEYHAELFNKQSEGYSIVPDKNGYPINSTEHPKPTAEQNKNIASNKLFETDWTTIPDVSDPSKSNPYLVNSAEFIAYRNQVRQYAINPIDGDINWPAKPQSVWSS